MENVPLPENPGGDARSPFRLAFDTVYNGLSRLEQRRTASSDDSALEARLAARDEASRQLAEQRFRLSSLHWATASGDPETEIALQQELEKYHTQRAQSVGASAIFLAAQNERFSGLKIWLYEKRQGYHNRLAQKASRKLLDLQ